MSVITGFDCNHSSCNSKIHRRIDEWCTIAAVKVHHTRCAVNWTTQKCTSRDPTKRRRPRQRQKVALMSKATTLHVHNAFLYISLPSLACTTTTWNDQSLSWVENGNGKAINFTISLWTQKRFPLFSSNLTFLRSSDWVTCYNGKSFKGRGVYFSATFSLASPLSDRKVPSNAYGHLYNTISLYFGFFNWSYTFRPMKGNPKVLDSGLLWVPDSPSVELDSGFQLSVVFKILELHSEFQSPGFPIPQAKISWSAESRFPYMGRILILGQ